MKAEAWVFGITALFVAVVAPAYWFLSEDHRHIHAGHDRAAVRHGHPLPRVPRLAHGPPPEDRKEGEIADGAGELGFFPPYSWWPLWCALALGVVVYGVALAAWWLVFIGFAVGAVVLSGFIFEYYRGEHAH